jgi:enterochelin esterase-like enzyme
MRAMRLLPFYVLLCITSMLFLGPERLPGQKVSATQLVELAKGHSADLGPAIQAAFEPKSLKDGTAWAGHGSQFFFAVQSSQPPMLVIDNFAPKPMEKVPGSSLWYGLADVEPAGRLHQFHYLMQGASFGGSLDLPVFGPLSYLLAATPSGTLSEPILHTSKIYDGMKSRYWIYVPAQYDSKTPAAVMVFQDGGAYIDRNGDNPALNTIDNLIAQKKIPVMICIFINPGDISGAPGTPTYEFVKGHSERWHRTMLDAMRSTEYDTVSDRYARFLREEILAEVAAKYNLRKDAYSHAIAGASSGGICSFNAAWQKPDEFSRVLSWIGSFTNIQWKEDPAIADGGQDYPDKILREPKRNIRVWLQDGSNDLSFPRWGDWPLDNIRMANSLKTRGYDFHFRFGTGTHNGAQGAVEFPEEMLWLWRDYDPDKTEESFTPDPEEKDKPYYKVQIVSRQ